MPSEILLPKRCSICGREIRFNDFDRGSWPTDSDPEGEAHGDCIDRAKAKKENSQR
jgi:hypothetical protein